MSSEQDRIRALARRIARRIEHGSAVTDAAPAASEDAAAGVLREQLARLEERLARLERQNGGAGADRAAKGDESETRVRGDHAARARVIATPAPVRREAHDEATTRAPRVLGGGGTYVSAVHPSQQRFGIDLAITELVDHFESAKRCDMEPGDKPCDDCGACSSRGF